MIPVVTLPLLLGTLCDCQAAEPLRDDRAWAHQVVHELTLREKVGQMVMPWMPGGRPARGDAEWRRIRRMIEEDKVGGIIVGRGDAAATAGWLNELQRLSEQPLLIAADLEWGAGTRLDGATLLPINMALAATGNAAYSYQAGRVTALEARAAGIHMAFAPVADVNVNPANPVINTRAFGADPYLVADHVVAFIEGARSGGMLSVVKHFPGHGDTDTDSHLALPLLEFGRDRLDAVEFVPFRAAIASSVSGVMTAHVAVPALEPDRRRRPATLSGPILTDLLRDELGFDGLIVTDALNMDGVRVRGGAGQIAVEAVLAGADILLMPSSARTAIDAVVDAVEAGRIPESRIDASVARILAAKASMDLDRQRTVNLDEMRRVLADPAHLRFAQEVADRSLTLVRTANPSLPAPLNGRRVVAIEYADGRTRSIGDEFRAELEARGARVQRIRLWERSNAADLRRAEQAASSADVVIFASYARAVPWRGRLGLPDGVSRLADRLAASGAVVISFGDPYLVTRLDRVQTYMLAWSEADVAQRAAARALAGEIAIVGRLPIPLPPAHALGEGIEIAPVMVVDETEEAVHPRPR